MSEQYEYINGSESGHCCFEASVRNIETEEWLCECFEVEDARKIVHCVNNHERLMEALTRLSDVVDAGPEHKISMAKERIAAIEQARTLLAQIQAGKGG